MSKHNRPRQKIQSSRYGKLAVIRQSLSWLQRKTITPLVRRFIQPSMRFFNEMQERLGRTFRRMGLPFWPLVGVGAAGWWFDNAGVILEKLIQDLFNLSQEPIGWQAYLPNILLFLIPCLLVIALSFWQRNRSFVPNLPKPDGKKGLILLVSNPNSAKFAIDYHFLNKQTLEKVWLIPSNNDEVERFGAATSVQSQEIEQYCDTLSQQHGRSLEVDIFSAGVSPGDAQDTFDVVNRIFRTTNYAIDEIIADFTGGTKPMSVGMIMACLPQERTLEYVSFNGQSRQSYGPFLIDYRHAVFGLD